MSSNAEGDDKMAKQANSNVRNDNQKVGPVAPGKRRVTNLMSGKEVDIAEDTPRSCDPSSELYWSM